MKMQQHKPKSCCSAAASTISTPIGLLRVCGCDQGMHSIELASKDTKIPTNIADLRVKSFGIERPATYENLPKPIQQSIDWLADYFSCGKEATILTDRYPPICTNLNLTQFSLNVYTNLASSITFGLRTTYGELARLIDRGKASRAVGTALKRNPFLLIIPCHRVTPKSGEIGAYCGGTEFAPLKQWLLEYEKSILAQFNDE